MHETVTTVASLADSFAGHGVWMAIAVLVVAVAYLFRELRKLEAEFRQSIVDSRDKHAALLVSCEQALQQTAASIRDFRTSLESLHEVIQILHQQRDGMPLSPSRRLTPPMRPKP